MKKLTIIFASFAAVAIWASCNSEARYLDLNTGEEVSLEKDPNSGLMVRTDTKEPVYIYVDTKTNDTIYGANGKVINGHVVKSREGKWKYENGDYESKVKSEDGEYKIKRGDDYKKEVEKDGDVTIKSGDKKIKIDGETGEKKVKNDD